MAVIMITNRIQVQTTMHLPNSSRYFFLLESCVAWYVEGGVEGASKAGGGLLCHPCQGAGDQPDFS